jgi:hypothetical protein
MVGGGVPGKDGGIAHSTTTQGGTTIKAFHPFMGGYPPAGGMTTGIVVGEGISGTTNGYITNKFNKTGRTGNRVGIGSKKRGVSKVWKTERGHNNNVSQVHNPEKTNDATHNNRGTMKEGEKNNMIEGKDGYFH